MSTEIDRASPAPAYDAGLQKIVLRPHFEPPERLLLLNLRVGHRFYKDQPHTIEFSRGVCQRHEERIRSKMKCHTWRWTRRTWDLSGGVSKMPMQRRYIPFEIFLLQ
ncbi:hypothetical protein B9Z55_023422 [Caenorhabditis nigoni]|nr:hypothetical protein B9Z55_023422 [Caenorhabditis nigoni]